MKIAFVFAPYHHKRFEENLFVVDEDFGILPPINLAYAAAFAERAGHEVILIDAKAARLTLDAVLSQLREFEPDIMGYYLSTYMFHETLSWIKEIKKAIPVPVVVGGVNCSLYPEETLSHSEIDYLVAGHADAALPALLDAVVNGESPAGLPGVGCRVDGTVTIGEVEHGPVDFDNFPFPARHLLDNSLYYSFVSQRKNFTVMMTSLGCPYDCSFCAIVPVPRGTRSVDSVIDEIDEVYHRHHVREIDFFDASFATSRRRTVELLERIAQLNLDLEFSCRARIDSLDPELLRLMKRAGCRAIYLGLESSSQQILDDVSKSIDPDRSRKVVTQVKEAGIRPLGFFMLGNPGETLSSALHTILYSLSLGLDYAQFSRTIAKPGSGLHRQLVDFTGEDYWREYVLGNAPERRLESPWTQLSQLQIDGLTKLGYYLFYYRPWYIARVLTRVRSPEELARYIRTGVRMLMNTFKFD